MNTTTCDYDFVICLPCCMQAQYYGGKKKTQMHVCVLGFVMRWLCLMFDTVFFIKKKHTKKKPHGCVCSKIMLWVSLSSGQHFVPLNTIALPVWLLYWLSGSVTWCELKSLLCCLASFLTLRYLFALFWFVECMTINALSLIIFQSHPKWTGYYAFPCSYFCIFPLHVFQRIANNWIIVITSLYTICCYNNNKKNRQNMIKLTLPIWQHLYTI